MIDEIIQKYNPFSDAIIKEISYKYYNDRIVKAELKIVCMNIQNNFNWEEIEIVFSDIVFFRFIGKGNFLEARIDTALVKVEDEVMIFDFCALSDPPTIGIEENPESEFIIKCKKIEYQILEQY